MVNTPPTEEPITLDEAKLHLRVDTSDEDDYIDALITQARTFLENQTRRAFIDTEFVLSLDEFPDEIRPPRGNLLGVTTIKYYDTDGVQQTLSSGLYQVDTASVPGRIVPAYGEVWPDTQVRINAVEVTYDAGFTDDADELPADLKRATMMMVAHWYEAREPIVTGTIVSEVPLAVKTIIVNNKIQEFF